MIPLSLVEIAAAVDGELHGGDPQTRVTGTVEFDSRKIGTGGLFVAFAGEKADGHDFAPAAAVAGAVAVLGSRPVAELPTIVVADPLVALARLARAVLDRLDTTVVAITGSSGKTTTKDLIGGLLSELGPTVAPPGTFNNELGLPYTVLKADADTRFLVLEMGARGVGHIKDLCEIAPPSIGVVVNVGVAHIGEFGSVEGIALAKSEIVQALPATGLAVLNGDDPRVAAMAGVTAAPSVLVGQAENADLRAVDVVLDGRGRPSYTVVRGTESARVELGLTGAHQVGNTLLAAAVALRCGLPWAELPAALARLRAVSTRRMDVFDRADGVTVIDDSYNANPASTAAALRALRTLGGAGQDERRTVAVLGYHAELGPAERDGHAEVGALAATLGVGLLIVVGESAAPILDGAASVRQWEGESVLVSDQAAAIGVLRERLRSADVVLVKGSRYRTWDVVDALRETRALQGASDGDGHR
ncbi:UDP-N-acetylmuramoyl-tripeptide--D-alanyl-D-alanine ligase [Catellatospora citrea]|uniref:UDP-N-acetylmuramoyl-tripeptide--D-alanyl-D-alanine ligase n=1 Tax=Catellatospora citrea TaxID=53366 RepID=A0A8J3K8L1_9ACTN|nr:UDP-N-acetylmuramoyl-tripeptide--D-alanyl-D-alanine ligase [Catellatospora citrea]RKE07114.1 UDP-N-acetylmuramoyl-tripeptide--D-alanyl-D-alanine ligase [Catellatospora citrea]GIF95266.1 UDP-N-acetylmuramoyl-tripeptide--D-alanyl-D-alanine ligase [Catellatospora citrea]